MTSGALECPVCGCKVGRCIDTRVITFRGVTFKRRKRVCHHCQYQYTTKEMTIPDDEAPKVNQHVPKPPDDPPLPQKDVAKVPMIEEGPTVIESDDPPPQKSIGKRRSPPPPRQPKTSKKPARGDIFPD